MIKTRNVKLKSKENEEIIMAMIMTKMIIKTVIMKIIIIIIIIIIIVIIIISPRPGNTGLMSSAG